MNRFWFTLGLPGASLGRLLDLMTRHCAARDRTFEAIVATPRFSSLLGTKKVLETRCFERGQCDENIANNVRIAYWAVFNAVRVQDHFWEGPGLPFWLHFGDFWVTLAHLGPHRGPHVHLFCASVRTFIFRCVFHRIWGPRGIPKKKSAAWRSPSGRMGKQHLAPLGRVPA